MMHARGCQLHGFAADHCIGVIAHCHIETRYNCAKARSSCILYLKTAQLCTNAVCVMFMTVSTAETYNRGYTAAAAAICCVADTKYRIAILHSP